MSSAVPANRAMRVPAAYAAYLRVPEDHPLSRPAPAVWKRVVDILGSAVLLVALSPVLAVIALAIRLTSRGPAFFVQDRIGYNCEVFRMLKFRTMRVGAHEVEEQIKARLLRGKIFFKLVDDPRVTPVGRFLRKFSLDELPQFVNVLAGDMSLVGPRPLLLSDFRKFPWGEQARRFAVKPGISGLWQVNGRSTTSDEERMELDLAYVEQWSPWLDLRILARTLPAVLRAEGAA